MIGFAKKNSVTGDPKFGVNMNVVGGTLPYESGSMSARSGNGGRVLSARGGSGRKSFGSKRPSEIQATADARGSLTERFVGADRLQFRETKDLAEHFQYVRELIGENKVSKFRPISF